MLLSIKNIEFLFSNKCNNQWYYQYILNVYLYGKFINIYFNFNVTQFC